MNRLVHALGNIIREKVIDATSGRTGTKLESRFIFHGPPIKLLEDVFNALASENGVLLELGSGNPQQFLPVLLQLPEGSPRVVNPAIGTSGRCDAQHLLDVRNDPHEPSFVALVPPGQQSNKSVTSTTDEFGIGAKNNSRHATFDEWWEDGFIQIVVTKGLIDAGIPGKDIDDARHIVRRAATAIDEMDMVEGSRQAVWRLISRIYSIPGNELGLLPGKALSLACGVPPTQDGAIDAKLQLGVLAQVAHELADGFKTGVDRLASVATDKDSKGASGLDVKTALEHFLSHIQLTCEVTTAFDRSTEAFYLPSDELELKTPPVWWETLTVETWTELLADPPDEQATDLSVSCTNSILPTTKGAPAVVRDEVELTISVSQPEAVFLSGGSRGKAADSIQVADSITVHDSPPSSGQRAPLSYKVTAPDSKAATARVISLATWIPGIFVSCRLAAKLTPPKKPQKASSDVDWEASLSLPGSGRYELIILVGLDTTIDGALGVPDDSTESHDESRERLIVQKVRPGEFQVEIETDGKYQLEITYLDPKEKKPQVCTVHISCEETREEGCRSEFERLIKLNRSHLDKFDTKAVVQLDRHARLSSLQAWVLDDQNVHQSFLPIVISDDYATRWAPPNWSEGSGPVLSHARFLHDPRPVIGLFQPPPGFVECRARIAERIRNTHDQSGLVESAPLGKWLSRDAEFRELVERYVDCYSAWLASEWPVACWVDVVAVCPREAGGLTLERIPDAIILSPLHPLRLAWHCLAQQALYDALEGADAKPCPAASVLDPDCVPDVLTMSLQSPRGSLGIDKVDFLSVECGSDYWSVLWNGTRLKQLASRSTQAPFDSSFGLVLGGISSGFSPAQVARALEDVSEILAAKPTISLAVSSAGGATDACNEGLASWCTRRFGSGDSANSLQLVGPRILEVYDTRPVEARPDQATIANLSEDTGNHVRWFDRQPIGSKPDIGIVAQLDSSQPECTGVGMRSPLSIGGLVRHRVRRQLDGNFLSESRQALPGTPSGNVLADKVAGCIVTLEGAGNGKVGLQFAPNVHAVSRMLEEQEASFVAVSSSAIDPACFLGGWIKGTYLWDYDLPAYSQRAGDTNGYYLLSQVRDADRDALKRVLELLPNAANSLDNGKVEDVLLEVARRGIPTVRGMSGDDTGATGDLGLFLAVRLLQDQFRISGPLDSLIPVLTGTDDDTSVTIIVPVDPFRGYLSDLARSLSKDRKECTLSRPDFLVVSAQIRNGHVRMRLTPVEVKCRQSSSFSQADSKDALSQAKALSSLFLQLRRISSSSTIWRLGFQHLLLSMIGFGLRVYSQHPLAKQNPVRWANIHEKIAAAILDPESDASIEIDEVGRLIVADGSAHSDSRDNDGDGFKETIVIAATDAARMVSGDAQRFYDVVRAKVGDWNLFPVPSAHASIREAVANACPPQTVTPTLAHPVPPLVPAPLSQDEDPSKATTLPDASPAGAHGHEQQPVDESTIGVVLEVGRSADGFEPRPLSLNISDTGLNNLNIGVVGDLGTGKTQLLKSLIFQISKAQVENRGIKPRFLIFDYKRDYSSPEFVAATGARVVKPTRMPLNLFDTTAMGESAQPWLDRFRFFTDVLDKVYSNIGPVQRDKLKGAVRNAYQSCGVSGRQPTIYDIHAEYRSILGDKSDSPMAIIDDLVDMEIFEPDLQKTKPFNEFFDGVVVISLDALGQDDRSKNMLVAIMLNMFYENMLRTPKRPFIGTDPQLRVIDSYLLVDEADNIMRYEFDVLRKLLLQGREFGTGVILASQYLRHFKVGGTDYRDPLLSWFIHKVPNVTPAELGALGITSELSEMAERVKTLPNHHCLYKTFDIAGDVIKGLPFYELQASLAEPTSR